jgi:hypothetical protein
VGIVAARPRSADRRPVAKDHLSDQQGDYVYVVDAQNKAQVRRVQQGQSTPTVAVISSGIAEGELGDTQVGMLSCT